LVQEIAPMKQPHTEQTVSHTDDQQNTGNHKKPGAPDAGGADRLGGTRSGAENLERARGDDGKNRLTEVAPARDERNRT
jgi:hypothetical protein